MDPIRSGEGVNFAGNKNRAILMTQNTKSTAYFMVLMYKNSKISDKILFRGEGDSGMALLVVFLSVKTRIGLEKLYYCVIDQSCIQRNWVNLA